MAFTSFKNIDEVVKKYNLFYDIQNIIPPTSKKVTPPIHLQELIQFNLTETVYDASEAALCESLIYPVLQEVWKTFKDKLLIWSHTSIQADDQLSGIPDYIIAQKSSFGRILGTPLVATIEAKKDNFDEGWTQCAAQLLAIQKINAKEEHNYILYGIVTNGEQWEFARLENSVLLRNTISFNIFDLAALYEALDFVFRSCYQQIK